MKSSSGNTEKAESCLGLLILSGPCTILFLFCWEVPILPVTCFLSLSQLALNTIIIII
jgi:hypothetical protein